MFYSTLTSSSLKTMEKTSHFKPRKKIESIASIWEQFLHGLFKHSAFPKYGVYGISLLVCLMLHTLVFPRAHSGNGLKM